MLIGSIGVRPFTFFEKGIVGHVGFADPFDDKIGKVFLRLAYQEIHADPYT